MFAFVLLSSRHRIHKQCALSFCIKDGGKEKNEQKLKQFESRPVCRCLFAWVGHMADLKDVHETRFTLDGLLC